MVKPMLCKLMVKPFNAAGWVWERKYDGFRALITVGKGSYSIQARSGTDKTQHFPELVFNTACPVMLDGEIISANDLSFQEGIQPRVNRLVKQHDMSIELPAQYMVFDLLAIGNEDVMGEPLWRRRQLLADIVRRTKNVQLAPQYPDGIKLFEKAKAGAWEGVIGKNSNQGYVPGKRLWIKVKCWLENTFMVVGFTRGTGKRAHAFGALHLADTKGQSVGLVGTGFTDAQVQQLFTELTGMITDYGNPNYWPVEPFTVRIKYLEVTNAGQLRFPVYLGRVK